MVDFIGMDRLQLRGVRTENYKMIHACTQLHSNPVPFAYEANALSIVLLDLLSFEHLKVDRVLSEVAIKIYLYHVVGVVKCFVVYYILLTLYSQQTL